MARLIRGRPIVPGKAEGRALVSAEPLSFWGGFNHKSGEITDRRHPLSGMIASGRVLALPFSRGSSTTSAVLLEAVRAGTAPAAILTTANDSFLALASIVADELYASPIPIIAISGEDFAGLQNDDHLTILENGMIYVNREQRANEQS